MSRSCSFWMEQPVCVNLLRSSAEKGRLTATNDNLSLLSSSCSQLPCGAHFLWQGGPCLCPSAQAECLDPRGALKDVRYERTLAVAEARGDGKTVSSPTYNSPG